MTAVFVHGVRATDIGNEWGPGIDQIIEDCWDGIA